MGQTGALDDVVWRAGRLAMRNLSGTQAIGAGGSPATGRARPATAP